jgi:hypothetical protein
MPLAKCSECGKVIDTAKLVAVLPAFNAHTAKGEKISAAEGQAYGQTSQQVTKILENLGKEKPKPESASQLRTDGPTLAEWIAKGYDPKKYPPQGYAAREEVKA